MTKRKIFILITAVSLILYGISVYIALKGYEDYYSDLANINHNEFANRVYDNLTGSVYKINDQRSISEAIGDLMYNCDNIAGVSRLKKFYVVINYKDRVFEPKSYIRFDFPESKYDGIKESLYVDMDEYLTEEVKNQIKEFMEKTKKDYFYIDYAELYQNGDEYIPVRIRLVDTYGYKNQTPIPQNKEYIVLSDYSPNVICDSTAENEFVYSYHYYFYDFSTNKKENDYDNYLFEKLKSKRAGFDDVTVVNLGISGTSSTFLDGGCARISYNSIDVNGEDILLKVGSITDCRETALNSNEFSQFRFYLTVLYLFVYVLVLVFSIKLHTKNQRLNEAKQTFVSAAAHELKTPISVIQNQCECVMENIAPEKNDEYIKSVYDESKRMGDVVSTMLWYNRLSTESVIKKQKESLTDIVLREVQKYESFAQTEGILIETDIEKDAFVRCDRTLLEMAVDNYLSNAIKYAKGEKYIKVSLKANRENSYIFNVFNTGDGISDEHKQKIWDVFWRADKTRNSEENSTGMGLAICKQIFRLHNYRFGFANKENGVEFYFVTK